jgi:GT2 family glycosyltransferase
VAAHDPVGGINATSLATVKPRELSVVSPARRVHVLHLEESEIAQAPRSSPYEEYLAIIWRDDRPIGQLYAKADSDGRLDAQALLELAERAEGRPNRPDVASLPRTATVVICTRDRADMLARTLASLREQTRPPDQIVVVDNASRDEATRAVALMAGVDYVREDRPGLDIARNRGARAATGEIVAYTDDDVAVHPRWLERLIEAFDSPSVAAVTGLVLPGELETDSQIVFERHWGFGRGFRRIDFDRDYFATHRHHGCPVWRIGAGASMAFRRETFASVGYFDERLDVGAAGCCGDSEYWYRILAAGLTCRYESSAVAFHFHRRERDALARQIFAYMRAHVVASFIQFERHKHVGNLRHVFLGMPYWYARRIVRWMIRGTDDTNRLLLVEMRGALAGLAYYLRARRTPAGIWP